MFKKRIILIIAVIILTSACYIFMNRNYDSLSRYPYGSETERERIKKYLDEREIKYIIDYSIDPYLFMNYMIYPDFIAYHIEDYNTLAHSLYYLTDYEVVEVVERLYEKNIPVDTAINKYMYFHYEAILKDLG